MFACGHPAFDGPVTLGFELRNCRRITGVLVGVDDPRRRMVLSAQCFGEEAFGRCCIAFSRQKEVDRRTMIPPPNAAKERGKAERGVTSRVRER